MKEEEERTIKMKRQSMQSNTVSEATNTHQLEIETEATVGETKTKTSTKKQTAEKKQKKLLKSMTSKKSFAKTISDLQKKDSSISGARGSGLGISRRTMSFIERLQHQTDGRLDEVWSSIYEGEDIKENNNNNNNDNNATPSTPLTPSTPSTPLTPSVARKKSFVNAQETVNVNSFMKLPDVLVCKYGERERIQASSEASQCDRFCMGGLYHSLRPIVAR